MRIFGRIVGVRSVKHPSFFGGSLLPGKEGVFASLLFIIALMRCSGCLNGLHSEKCNSSPPSSRLTARICSLLHSHANNPDAVRTEKKSKVFALFCKNFTQTLIAFLLYPWRKRLIPPFSPCTPSGRMPLHTSGYPDTPPAAGPPRNPVSRSAPGPPRISLPAPDRSSTL